MTGRPRIVKRRGPIYVAASLPTSQTPHYADCVAWLLDRYPNSGVIEGSVEFTDTQDWKSRWPDVRNLSSKVVAIPGEDGIIGAGTFHEIGDAVFKHIPVFVLPEPGSLVSIRRVALSFHRPTSPSRFALVQYWESA